ncbi:MAG: hypothetical protein M3N48_07675 [Verrucomicrobiota bacterium]|nr:hypothetical protein [Verrucomicrobiota bacterium]
MKHLASPLILILISAVAHAQTSVSILSPARRESVERLAHVYKIPLAEATKKYEAIVGGNRDAGGPAVGSLRKQGAFELLISAFGDVKDESMKELLLEEILEKRDFSPTACTLLLDQLDAFNGPTSENKEVRSGHELKKRQIATLISRGLEIPDPKIPFAPFKSQPAYHNFSVQARAKAAKMTRNSPF